MNAKRTMAMMPRRIQAAFRSIPERLTLADLLSDCGVGWTAGVAKGSTSGGEASAWAGADRTRTGAGEEVTSFMDPNCPPSTGLISRGGAIGAGVATGSGALTSEAGGVMISRRGSGASAVGPAPGVGALRLTLIVTFERGLRADGFGEVSVSGDMGGGMNAGRSGGSFSRPVVRFVHH